MFDSTVQKILFAAVLYVFLTSVAIFVHWMWFSNYDIVIGKKMRKGALKPGDRVFMKGLALPSSYYEAVNKKKEERRIEEARNQAM